MNRTPIASPPLLVGRDATETWHGSDDAYREVGFSAAIGTSLLARLPVVIAVPNCCSLTNQSTSPALSFRFH